MDAAQFNAAVCHVVQMIPPQKVTSCTHIAKLIEAPSKARRVSEVVRFLGLISSDLPWHRVISTSGIIARHGDLGNLQRILLEREGVPVFTGEHGEWRVMFTTSGWFPEHVDVFYERDSNDEWGS